MGPLAVLAIVVLLFGGAIWDWSNQQPPGPSNGVLVLW